MITLELAYTLLLMFILCLLKWTNLVLLFSNNTKKMFLFRRTLKFINYFTLNCTLLPYYFVIYVFAILPANFKQFANAFLFIIIKPKIITNPVFIFCYLQSQVRSLSYSYSQVRSPSYCYTSSTSLTYIIIFEVQSHLFRILTFNSLFSTHYYCISIYYPCSVLNYSIYLL